MLMLSYTALACNLLSALFALFLLARNRSTSPFNIGTLLFLIIIASMSFISGNDWKHGLYLFLTVFAYITFFYYYQNQYKLLVVTVLAVLSLGVYVQLFQCIMHPEMWMIEDIKNDEGYILGGGNYNTIGPRILLALSLAVISRKYNKCLGVNTVLLFIASIAILFMVKSMTSLTCIVLFTLICLIPTTRLKKQAVILILIGVILFQFLVCFSGKDFENNHLANWFIVDILGKDMTFTGRTELWDASLNKIVESPLFGYGFVDRNWYYSNISHRTIGSHNFILNLMIYGGITSLIIYLFCAVKGILRIFRLNNSNAIYLLVAFSILNIMMLFESYEIAVVLLFLTFMIYFPDGQF